MLRLTSPQIATRTESRKKITSPGGVTGRVDDAKAGDLVALRERPVDGVGRALPEPGRSPRDRVRGGGDGTPSLHRVDITGVAGKRNAPRLTDGLGDPLVIGVHVGQRQHRELSPLDLREDAAPV